MKKVTIYFSDPQYEKLKQVSKRDDISFAELVRRAVDGFLEGRQRKGIIPEKGIYERDNY